jgi:hypothetical protein
LCFCQVRNGATASCLSRLCIRRAAAAAAATAAAAAAAAAAVFVGAVGAAAVRAPQQAGCLHKPQKGPTALQVKLSTRFMKAKPLSPTHATVSPVEPHIDRDQCVIVFSCEGDVFCLVRASLVN